MTLARTAIDSRRVGKILAELEKRGIHGIFADDRKKALSLILKMIPEGSSVAHGSSTSLKEIGFVEHLIQHRQEYHYLNLEWAVENNQAKRRFLRATLSAKADCYLGSVQAICETGELLGADAGGSRIAFYAYGPSHVILVAGLNKIVPNLQEGLRRIREVALPLEDKRIRSGGGGGSYIGKIVIIEREMPGRITVILVGEPLGY